MYDERFAYLAPQAAANAWYPYSFMAPIEKNEALALLRAGQGGDDRATKQLLAGLSRDRIFVCGFSQGGLPVERVRGQKPPRAMVR